MVQVDVNFTFDGAFDAADHYSACFGSSADAVVPELLIDIPSHFD